jgi:hypothetical protein
MDLLDYLPVYEDEEEFEGIFDHEEEEQFYDQEEQFERIFDHEEERTI